MPAPELLAVSNDMGFVCVDINGEVSAIGIEVMRHETGGFKVLTARGTVFSIVKLIVSLMLPESVLTG